MQTIQIIVKLLSQKGVSAAKMCNELGFSSGLFYQWKKGPQKPSIEKLTKMAEYFNVSTDYLLGKEQKNKPAAESDELDPLDTKIMELFSKLNPANKKLALAQIEAIIKSQDNG